MKILLKTGHVESYEVLAVAKAKGLELYVYELDRIGKGFNRVNPDTVDHWNEFVLLPEDVGPFYPGDFEDSQLYEFDVEKYREDAELISYIEENPELFEFLMAEQVQEDRAFIIQKDFMDQECVQYIDELKQYKCTSEGLVVTGGESND